MNNRKFFALAAASALLAGAPVFGALNLEGQSGVFLNSLAYTLPANQMEVASHYVNLDVLGDVATYNFSLGVKDNLEFGFTQITSDVGSVADQSVLLAKYNVAKESKKSPAVSLWTIRRELEGGSSALDLGVIATKVYTVGKRPLIVDIGVRSTKALGLGLFGIGDDRELKWEGAVGYMVTPKLCIATEQKQQIDGETWKDIAVRYHASKHLNIDAGVADLGPGIDNQVAFALTWKK